jgi:diguanylate cyclase (GGDEF)-like protein
MQTFEQLLHLTRMTQPKQQSVIEMLSNGKKDQALKYLMKEVIPLQNRVMKYINEMIEAQKKVTENIAIQAKKNYQKIKHTMGIIYLVCFILAIFIAVTVTKKIQNLEKLLLASYQLLQSQITKDSLTGLSNRHYFDKEIREGWLHCCRSNIILTVMMIDIDHFKLYNATYGYVTGDEVLKHIADILKNTIHRQTDIIARYAGEKFVIVLPTTNSEDANKIAKEIVFAIQASNIKHITEYRKITVSIGISTAEPDKDSDYTTIIKTANNALYEAKEKGGNQITIHPII